MLIDCFPMFNEINMLRFRLNLLKDVVDKTVIVEANSTFSGKPKPLHFEQNRHLFKDYDIEHVVVSLPDQADPWTRERIQRNAIKIGLDRVQPYPHDHVIISDLDELPDPETLKHIKESQMVGMVALEQDLYYYHLECRAKGKWHKAKVCDMETFCDIGEPERVRHHSCPHQKRGGWHCSYFGDVAFVRQKLEAYSHQENNTERFKNHEHIMKCMRECKDLFDRGDGWDYIPLNRNPYLPPNWRAL